jgi:hypothetical protein
MRTTSLASPATSPLPNPCPVQGDNPPDQINWPNTEVEPQVAVNPTDPNNVIGVFQEDRWTDGGAHGLLAAVSFNGGGSYINDWAEFSACSDIPATPETRICRARPTHGSPSTRPAARTRSACRSSMAA